jgi:two-component system nitrogen regulation sensor histidine kinase NtrY
VLTRFGEIQTVLEQSQRYFDAIVQHVGTGIIAFKQSGEVELLNPAARALFDVAALKNISDLDPGFPGLSRSLEALVPGERKLVTVNAGGEARPLSFHATQFVRGTDVLKLVSIQNIGLELDEKEMSAWRDMVRVLTHEIKNSLTPIVSLAGSVEKLVVKEGDSAGSETRDPKAQKVREALQIIQRRSQGLLEFVDAYRDLTHLPPPRMAQFEVKGLFDRVEQLIAPHLEETAVGLVIETRIEPPGMSLVADPQMVEQALINLALNAFEATADKPDAKVLLEAFYDHRSRPVIQVTDDGRGIIPESIEKIFIPFYSTKKGGSGIGLSLSRQIMRLHRGVLTAASDPGVRTVFTMRF